ncbi:hypothetical protein, partial [Lactobacillus helveticus]|uniref:hypothetical protein n=1 Tax=Lactobacillus helveticus TaxID=1587 RepID=UPI001C27181A
SVPRNPALQCRCSSLLASSLMPWAQIQAHFPSLKSSLQIPYRLAVGASPLILLGVGISMTN